MATPLLSFPELHDVEVSKLMKLYSCKKQMQILVYIIALEWLQTY